MAEFILYGTAGCHLCEDAERVLAAAGIAHASLDIADDPQLLTRFGLLIPVLQHADSGQQLNWPFAAGAAMEFYQATAGC